MNIGLTLPQTNRLAIEDVARIAEHAGFASLWASDRLLAPLAPRTPYPGNAKGELPPSMNCVLDPFLSLTAAAAATSTIALGTSVLVAPWYSPLLLARMAASLDQLSGGRFTLGLGIGWSIDEFEAAGVSASGLGDRLDEILDVLDAAWTEEIVSVKTSTEHVAPSVIGLKPTRGRVPTILAAFTPRGLERIARRADGWNPAGIPIDAVIPMWRGILESAERIGRDPKEMRLVVRANVTLTDRICGERPDFVGSIHQVRDDIARCATTAVDELIIDVQEPLESIDALFYLLGSLTTRVPLRT